MPPTHKLYWGDKVLLFDGTVSYYGLRPVRLSHIEAVYRNGIWNTYTRNRQTTMRSIFRFLIS